VIALDPRFGPLAEATARIEQLPLDGLLTYLIESVPAEWLPELGRQFHIMSLEGWQFAATDADRRRLIRESIAIHRKKGTPWAVKRALSKIGVEADLIERRDVRAAYLSHSPLLVDGSWRLDGAGHTLKPVDILSGLPYIEHWASYLVRINLDMARGYDTDAVRAAIREWSPVSRHPVLFYWLAQRYLQPLASEYRLLLDKRVCHPYIWPGATLHGCPNRAWRLGKQAALDGRPFGFPLGASLTPTERIRSGRAASHAAISKACTSRVWSAQRLPAVRVRRLDGRWRLGGAPRIGRFALDGRRLTRASFSAATNSLLVSSRWRVGGPMTPIFEMRTTYV
jgi:phage tail P2-like protein